MYTMTGDFKFKLFDHNPHRYIIHSHSCDVLRARQPYRAAPCPNPTIILSTEISCSPVMDEHIMISVQCRGQCKLVSVSANTMFDDFVSMLVSKWGEVIKGQFSCTCSVGDMSNICLECEDDLKNLWMVCKITKVNIISAVLCIPSCEPPRASSPVDVFTQVEPNSSSSVGSQPNGEGSSQGAAIVGNTKAAPSQYQRYHEIGAMITLPTYDVCPYVKRKPMLSDGWAEIMTKGVGSVFKGGAVEFRIELIKYSSQMGFKFIYKKNDSRYIHAVCNEHIDSNCEWSVRAKRQAITGFFEVSAANLVHKCVGKLVVDDNRRIGTKLMGQLLVHNVKSKPAISGKDIVRTMKDDYGFEIPYWKAHRAVEVARSQIWGSFDESYDHLKWYTEAVLRSNPGSVVSLVVDDDTHEFERVFIAFKGCIEGFKSCRPLLFVDGTFTKGRGMGILLVATTKDADNGLFPVAVAVVSAENEDNWAWFLQMLRDNITHEEKISYISDRNKGLLATIPKVLDEKDHFYCLFHLITNLKGCKGGGWNSILRAKLVDQFTACAYAPNERIFADEVDKFIEMGGKKAELWISQLKAEKWAFSHSPNVNRYGEMTSNVVESFNNWIMNVRSLPITSMLEDIRKGICRWYVERRKVCESWNGVLVKSKQDLWEYFVDAGRTWFVTECPGGDFEVMSSPSVLVDLQRKTCSCFKWQLTGFPCVHAVAVIRRRCDSVLTYVDKYFHKTAYEGCYNVDIHPILETLKFDCQSDDYNFKILPPTLKRWPGRPPKKRQPSFGETPVPRKTKSAKHDRL